MKTSLVFSLLAAGFAQLPGLFAAPDSHPSLALTESGLTFYVSATANPGGDGSAHTPLQNLTQARDEIRRVRQGGKLAKNQAVTVLITPGDYRLENTLEFGPEDGGSADAPVIYKSSTPGEARFYGGTMLSPQSFQPIKQEVVRARLDPAVRDKVLVCDLAFLNHIHAFPAAYAGVPPGPWLYVDSVRMTLARWPNEGDPEESWAAFSKVIDTGLPEPESTDPALQQAHPGTFVFEDSRPGRWNFQQGVWLMGYWTHDWFEEVIRVAKYDPQNKTITLAAPHKYGIMAKTWGGESKRRFYAQNLFEELDAPGEWYLDRETRKLYFYPPKTLGTAKIVLATLTSPLIKAKGAAHLKFVGMRFEYSHSNGVELEDTREVEIAGCTFTNLAGTAITLSGNGNVVRSCELSNLGFSGIVLDGGSRKTLEPAGNLALNNHIHHYGQFKRTYSAGIKLLGCGQVVRNNCIHDAPHNAIHYSGNEHLMELNEVYRVVMETTDSGAFYTGRDWASQGNVIRHNYIHDLGSSASHYKMGIYLDDCDSGDTVEGNIFARAGRAIMIGGGRDNLITNNVVIECAQGLSLDARGMTWKQVSDPPDPSWRLEDKAKEFNYTQPPWSEKYPRLAAIMNEEPRQPLNNPICRNVFIDCFKNVWQFDPDVIKLLDKLVIRDNLVVNTRGSATLAKPPPHGGFEYLAGTGTESVDLGFVDPQKGNFTLRPNALLLQRLPGFKPVPFEKIGRFRDQYNSAK